MKRKNSKVGGEYNASIWLLIGMLIITTVLLSWLFYKPIQKFHTRDKYPELVPLTPQKIINFGGSPSFVTVGMYIRDLPEFDIVKGSFIADLTIWFKFDPRLVSLEQISKFSFDRAKVLQKSPPSTRIDNTELIARYDMRVEFTTELDYKNFPLDDHRINLSLTHYYLSPSDIIFSSSRSNLIVNSEIEIHGWELLDKGVKTGFVEYKLNPYDKRSDIYHPRTIFSFDFARVGIRHIMSIFVPIILIFFIALFTFGFDPFGTNAGNIMTLSVASITASIAHRFVIENMSPAAGYFMISDYIFLIILIICCSIFLINFFSTEIRRLYKNMLVILIGSIVILSFVWLLLPLT